AVVIDGRHDHEFHSAPRMRDVFSHASTQCGEPAFPAAPGGLKKISRTSRKNAIRRHAGRDRSDSGVKNHVSECVTLRQKRVPDRVPCDRTPGASDAETHFTGPADRAKRRSVQIIRSPVPYQSILAV